MAMDRRLRSRAGTFINRLRKMIFGIQTSTQSVFSMLQDKIDYDKEVSDLTSSDVVMAPIHWMMRTFPEAPIALQEWILDKETGEMHNERIMEHAFLDLINEPNSFYTAETLWASTVLSYAIDGNAYWMKIYGNSGMPVQLWWVPHMMMEPLLPGELDSGVGAGDADVYINYYRYSVPGLGEYFVKPEDVVHFRFGNDPDNPRKGLSPLKSAVREIYTDQEASDWTATLLRNGAVPGLTVSPETSAGNYVDVNDLRASKQYMEDQFRGRGRGRPHVSTVPIRIEQFGFSPEQMSLKDLRRLPEERISALLGIPAIVAGLGAGLDRSTFSNMSEAREMAYESNIIPTQRIFAATLNHQLLQKNFMKPMNNGRGKEPAMGDDKKLDAFFDISSVRVLQEDENAKVERLSRGVSSGWIRVAEARRELGLPTNEFDEVYLRPQGIGEINADEERPDPVDMMLEMQSASEGMSDDKDDKEKAEKDDRNEKDTQQQTMEKEKEETEGSKVYRDKDTIKVMLEFAKMRKEWNNERAELARQLEDAKQAEARSVLKAIDDFGIVSPEVGDGISVEHSEETTARTVDNDEGFTSSDSARELHEQKQQESGHGDDDQHDSGDDTDSDTDTDGDNAEHKRVDKDDADGEAIDGEGVQQGDVAGDDDGSDNEGDTDSNETSELKAQGETNDADEQRGLGSFEQVDERRDSGSGTGTGGESTDRDGRSDSGSDRGTVGEDAKRADGTGTTGSGGGSGLQPGFSGGGGLDEQELNREVSEDANEQKAEGSTESSIDEEATNTERSDDDAGEDDQSESGGSTELKATAENEGDVGGESPASTGDNEEPVSGGGDAGSDGEGAPDQQALAGPELKTVHRELDEGSEEEESDVEIPNELVDDDEHDNEGTSDDTATTVVGEVKGQTLEVESIGTGEIITEATYDESATIDNPPIVTDTTDTKKKVKSEDVTVESKGAQDDSSDVDVKRDSTERGDGDDDPDGEEGSEDDDHDPDDGGGGGKPDSDNGGGEPDGDSDQGALDGEEQGNSVPESGTADDNVEDGRGGGRGLGEPDTDTSEEEETDSDGFLEVSPQDNAHKKKDDPIDDPYESGAIMFGLLDALGIQYKRRSREADQLIENLKTALPALAGILDRELEEKFAELGTLSRSVFLRNSNLILTVDDDGNFLFAPDKLGDAVDQLRLTDWKVDELEPLFESHAARVAQNTIDSIGTVMNIAIDVPDPVMRQLILDGGKRVGLVDIEGDTRRAIFRSLHEGRSLGEGAQPLARRIREEVPAGRFGKAGSKYRSMLIARTETKWAQNESSLRAYESHEDITRVIAYDAQLGADRSDPTCIMRNGQTFTLPQARVELSKEHPNGTLSFAPIVKPGARRGGREDGITTDATRTGETPHVDDIARPWQGPPSGVDPRNYTAEQIREAERLYPQRLRTSYRTRPINGQDARQRVASIHEPIEPTLDMLSNEIGTTRQALVKLRDDAYLNYINRFDEASLTQEVFENIWFNYLDEMLVTKRRYYQLAQQKKYIQEVRDDLIFKALEPTAEGRNARWVIHNRHEYDFINDIIKIVEPTELDALIIEDGMNMFNRMVRQWPRSDIEVEFVSAPTGRAGAIPMGNNRTLIVYDGYQNRYWYEEWETIVHEMGHALSTADKNIFQEAVDFLYSKTKGERLRSMREMTGLPYGPDEMGRADEFFNPYVGLEYKMRARDFRRWMREMGDEAAAFKDEFIVSPFNKNELLTGEEVVSMGLEFMVRAPYLFSRVDKDHFDFILERIMYRDMIDSDRASYQIIRGVTQ